MPIAPDTKDWTWVVTRPCPECGFDASVIAGPLVSAIVRQNRARWLVLLGEGAIRSGRPDPATWSSLEYACHVRDVYLRYDERIRRMVEEDDPLYLNWDQDLSATEDGYDAQDPAAVVAGLADAAERVARRLEAVSGSEWDRPGRRSDGATFTIDTISRYMAHDTVHHVWDVTRPVV